MRSWNQGLMRAVALVLTGLTLWLPGAVLASAAALTAGLWLWSGTENSLRQMLTLAEPFVPELENLEWNGLDATLREGGKATQITWKHDGLTIVADEPSLHWNFLPFLLGQAMTLEVKARTVRVTDQRPSSAEPAPPPDSLALPVAIGVEFDLGSILWTSSGTRRPTEVTQRLRGRYTYGDDAQGEGQHQVQLTQWAVAQGNYQGEIRLGSAQPMAMSARLTGTLTSPHKPANATAPTQALPDWQAKAVVQITGDLHGPQATLALNAQVDSAAPGPRAELQANLQPWQAQPLLSLSAKLQRLDLSTFWPSLPSTQLSGSAQATPVPSTDASINDSTRWAAAATLVNGTPGPLDGGKLPVSDLNLTAEGNAAAGQVTLFKASAGEGLVEGSGSWQGSVWAGQLLTQGVQLEAMDTRLPYALLSGTVQAKQRPRTAKNPHASTLASVNLSAQASALVHKKSSNKVISIKRQASLSSSIEWNGKVFNLQDARLAWDGSNLQAQGSFTPANLTWEGDARLQVPGLRANSEGQLGPDAGLGRLTLALGDGAAFNAWLASLPGVPASLKDELPLVLGQGDLQWQGGWRSPELQLKANAQLQQVTAPASGPGGAWSAQAVNLSLSGTEANWQASASGRLQHNELQAQLSTTLQGQTPGWVRSNDLPDSAKTWNLRISQLNLALGPKNANPTLRLEGAQPLVLNGRNNETRLAAGALSLNVLPTKAGQPTVQPPLSLAWQDSQWGPDGLVTRGQFSALRIDHWASALSRLGVTGVQNALTAAGMGGDLALKGEWQWAWSGQPSAPPQMQLTVERQSGDLLLDETVLSHNTETASNALPEATRLPLALGLTQAKAEWSNQGEALSFRMQWDSARAGQVQAQGLTRLAPGPHTSMQGWLPQRSASLQATVKAQMSDIGVWSRLAPPGWRVGGHLGLEASLGGTLGQPDWQGNLQADALELRSVVEGLSFVNGTLRAKLTGDRMEITRFSLEGAGGAATGGVLELTGNAVWPPPASGTTQPGVSQPQVPSITLQATARQLRVSARADRRLTVSGQANAQLRQGLLTLRGKLKADQAQFILPDETTPALGSDVVVRLDRAAVIPPTSVPMRTDVMVEIDLGPRFEVSGQGLQTRLSGELTVSSPPRSASFQVLGEVRAVNGTYRAYGQPLRIEDGVLRFSGPLDDPSLTVLALRGKVNPSNRSNDDQQVGVRITGSARSPRVTLYANPDLPDSEKLAWLVLGRAATGLGAEAALLQQAALALLSDNNGRGLDANLAAKLGLDDISLQGGTTLNSDGTTTKTTAISLGKRLSNKVYVAYEQSLSSATGAVSLFYEVSRRLTVRAQAGQDSALDLIFTVQHD